MKKFKDILNEFRGSIEPPGRGGDNSEDKVKQVIKFMETVPFEHKTRDGDVIKFNDSKDAGLMIATAMEKHERAWRHSRKLSNGVQSPNTRYFANSFASHTKLLDNLENHIANHPKLPVELKPHVTTAVDTIESEGKNIVNKIEQWGKIAAPKNQNVNMGEMTYNKHKTQDMQSHPHEQNEIHHFKDMVDEINDDSDIGYVIRREEM